MTGWDFLAGLAVGLVAGATLGVLLLAMLMSGAREDRVRGEMLTFEDLGRERVGA